MPERVQLRRVKGWKMPANTVKVDRTTRWGNPFVPGRADNPEGVWVQDKHHACELYRAMAVSDATLVAAARAALHGKNLACWCAPGDPCHAAVLLQLANEA